MLHPFALPMRLAGLSLIAFAITVAPVNLSAAGSPPVSVLLQINRVAGSPTGTAGGPTNARPAQLSLLNQPEGVSIDGGGNLYIADTANDQIERIDADTGNITTVAANGLLGFSGTALLSQPTGVLVDPHGNLYIADTGNHRVRFVAMATGIITTIAGNPADAPFEPTDIGDGGPATQAALDSPIAFALDGDGNLYIADAGDNRVRKISPATGVISTVAGTGVAGYSGDNVLATTSELNHPNGIAVDLAGNLYISDSGNNLLREVVLSSGMIRTVAGVIGASGGYNGDNMVATQTTLNFPAGIAVDFSGQIYLSDRDNHRIRKVGNDGIVSTVAGNGIAGFVGDGGLASAAEVDSPAGIALDHEGNLYVADSSSNSARVISKGLEFPATEVGAATPPTHTLFVRINSAAVISIPTIAETQAPTHSAGATPTQEFSVGNLGGCVADGSTVNPAGAVCATPITFTPQYPGLRTGALQMTVNGASSSIGLFGVGLGPQAIAAPGIIETILDRADVFDRVALTAPQRMAVNPTGKLYVADPASNVVWAWRNRTVATPTIVAGGGTFAPNQANGGPATDAALEQPNAVALDAAGNLYIAETGANLVRKVNLTTGIISTVVGTGTAGYAGDGGNATSASLNAPAGIAANAAGDLFIADTGNNAIRRVYALGGIIFTIAGAGSAGYSGDGGDAVQAQLNHPQSATLDATGRLFIADTGNNVVRVVDTVTQSISTVAGNGTAGFSGDGEPAVSAELHHPSDVAIDAAGNLYIADTGNARVRKVFSRSGVLVTLVGSARVGETGDGGPANAAALTSPTGVAVDSLGQLWVSDSGNDTVRSVSYTASTLDFGPQRVGGETAGQSGFLLNIGNQPLAIEQFPTSPIPVDFILTSEPNECSVGSVAPGDQCEISFAFRPSTAGPLTEDAWISDNSLDVIGTQLAVVMTGVGVSASAVPTAITLAAVPSSIPYGASVRLTAKVSDAMGPVSTTAGLPTGTVVFMSGSTQLGTSALNIDGQAGLTTQQLLPGKNLLAAVYPGNQAFLPSTSTSVTVFVAHEMLTMTIRPVVLDIPAGNTGQAALTLTPTTGFSDTVSLSCAGLIRGATCQFSFPHIPFSSHTTSPQSITLVIDPHTLTVAGIPIPAKTIPLTRLGLLLLGLGALLLPFVSRRRATNLGWGRILLVVLCVGLGSVLGCADLAPPPAISDEITVQASTPTQGVIASAQLVVNMAQ